MSLCLGKVLNPYVWVDWQSRTSSTRPLRITINHTETTENVLRHQPLATVLSKYEIFTSLCGYDHINNDEVLDEGMG